MVEQFYREIEPQLAKFILYGSGDFHHLTGLWLRSTREPVTLVSFDNHPDWDVRPPRWCCGGWINRALELPHVRQVGDLGLREFRVLVAASAFRESQSGTRRHAYGAPMGG